MAPLIARLRREGSGMEVRVLSTGQHRGLLEQALGDFGIKADDDLKLMRPDQGLVDLAARAIAAVSNYLVRVKPDIVLAQGDTTTVCATALACYYGRFPFAHVESGLRTGRPHDPFPEEKNRLIADHLAELHFAPTWQNRENLLREGITAGSIHVTGNTVIDALFDALRRDPGLPIQPATPRYLLVTAHRRESFGAPQERLCQALVDLVARHPDLSVVFPVHPNPNVRAVVVARLGERPRIHLIEPVSYASFVALMKNAFAILTDSGGVQEEAPSLDKPVVVVRETTERSEAVEAGKVEIVGTGREAIVGAVDRLIADPSIFARSVHVPNPHGDGWASERIARVLAERFGLDPGPWPPGVAREWRAGEPADTMKA